MCARMVGGRDFDDSQFNRAIAGAAAAGLGLQAVRLCRGARGGLFAGDGDRPTRRADHDAAGRVDAGRRALDARCDDAAHGAAHVEQPRGGAAARRGRHPERPCEYAKRLGVGAVPSVPSLALGSGEVTLQSMTAAYAAFANAGMLPHADPHPPRRGRATGEVLFDDSADVPQRAVSETTAFLMSNMLADVVNAGTACKARSVGFTLPAAGKTGTTNDYVDAWFVGYTPKLVAGRVGWLRPAADDLRNGYAGRHRRAAVGPLHEGATRNDKPSWFKPPSGIVSMDVCRMSGKLPAGGCDDVAITNNDGTTVNRSVIQTGVLSSRAPNRPNRAICIQATPSSRLLRESFEELRT